MSIEELKKQLSNRINAEAILALSDEELNKYLKTAEMIISIIYSNIDILTDEQVAMLLSEEVVFLFNSNIDLNIFYEYNGLTSFDIGGAVKGSVDYRYAGSVVSPLVKAMADSLGLITKVDFDTNHKTAFARV